MSLLSTGSPAPQFTLPDLSGNRVSLADFRGRILILNFWSAECPWALRVDEALALYLPGWGKRVQLVAVASNKNENDSMLAKAAARRGIDLVLDDRSQLVADLYGGVTTPHFFVVDEKGILRYQGAYDDVTFRQRQPTRAYLPEAIQALLAGKQPPLSETPTYGCTIVRIEDEG